MTTGGFSEFMIGRLALAAGIAGLLGLVFLILFFTIGQPFGTLNDICIGLAAILSAFLAWMLLAQFRTQSPLLSQAATILALAGALVVVVGSVLVISQMTGWFLAGLYMAAGNALIALWLLSLSYSALGGNSWPHSLIVFGIVAGLIMVLGLACIPGIFRGINAMESAPWYISYIGQAGALGYLVLYPIWCIWLSRVMQIK